MKRLGSHSLGGVGRRKFAIAAAVFGSYACIAADVGHAQATRAPKVELAGKVISPADESASPLQRVREIENEQMVLKQELLSIRNREGSNGQPTEAAHRAADLLLRFSPPEAMPFLVHYIDWENTVGVGFDFGPYAQHPHARALWTQGSEAIPVMLRELRLSPSERVSDRKIELFAYQLLCVYGVDAAGRARAVEVAVTTDAEKARDADAADNLRRLTERLESLPKFVPGR